MQSARLKLIPCPSPGAGRQPRARKKWLGREDSNLRMRVPKTRAFPLGHAPTQYSANAANHSGDAINKGVLRSDQLWRPITWAAWTQQSGQSLFAMISASSAACPVLKIPNTVGPLPLMEAARAPWPINHRFRSAMTGYRGTVTDSRSFSMRLLKSAKGAHSNYLV